jgi:muconate cycloisomerase
MFDAVGKTLGLPVSALLGGAVRTSVPVLWTLASGDAAQEIEEAERKLGARLHRTFKIKIGAQEPAKDMARLTRISRALGDRAELIVDVNQAWDETISGRFLPQLRELGVALVEQPVPAWNIEGLARLRRQAGGPPLLADECVFTAHDMMAVARANAADAVSLKLVKHGGLLGLKNVAAVAQAAGIGLYGGCLLESSIGAAAHLHVFATLPALAWGCEHFGPQILVDDLVVNPLRFENFEVHLPEGPGLGLSLDEDKLQHFARS